MSAAEHPFHVVDGETGESIDCPNCEHKDGVIGELNHKLNAALGQVAALKRNHEKEARASQLWPIGERLFEIWKGATTPPGKKRSPARFTYKRFSVIEPFIRELEADGDGLIAEPEVLTLDVGIERPPNGIFEECCAAIIGRVDDHFAKQRKNGTTIHYFEFERIFEDPKQMEESRDRRPRDWRDRLKQLDPGPIVRGPRAVK